jgi:hypothetical protein
MPKTLHKVSIAVLMSLMATVAIAADDFATLSYPLALNVEGEHVRSKVYLKLRVKPYGQSFDSFAAGELDAREAKFAEFVRALRRKDTTKVTALLRQEMKMEETSAKIRPVERTPKQIVEMYTIAFGGLRDITVLAQVLAGSKSLFIWEAAAGEGKFRRAFSVAPIGSKLFVSEVTMGNPVELLIVNNLFNAMMKNPDAYRPVADLKTSYEYAFPLEGRWNPGPNPVTIQFEGQPLDVPIFDETSTPSGAIPALYHDTYIALRNGQIESFLKHFTEKSQTKWQRWRASMPAPVFDQYRAAMTRDRSLKFVLDAGPVLIAFHGDPGTWTAGSLKYDYIVHMPRSGELKFANVSFRSFFDDVIGNEALFDQNVFRGQTVAEAKTPR